MGFGPVPCGVVILAGRAGKTRRECAGAEESHPRLMARPRKEPGGGRSSSRYVQVIARCGELLPLRLETNRRRTEGFAPRP